MLLTKTNNEVKSLQCLKLLMGVVSQVAEVDLNKHYW